MSLSFETEQAEGSFDIIGSLPERTTRRNNVPHAEGEAGDSPLVQTLYEGPRKCGCCINWVDYLPLNADESGEDGEEELPIVLRHSVSRGEDTSRVSIHSIEIRDPAARAVLFPVFEGFDRLNPSINYLVFHAPFKPFFYRWSEFEQAVDSCTAPSTKAVLEKLHTIVKAELAEAFAIRDELVKNGVISYPYLWTIFQPGEILCEDESLGGRRFYYLEDMDLMIHPRPELQLFVQYVDYYARFGFVETDFSIPYFQGTRSIVELPVYPARFVPDFAAAKQSAISRGRRFSALVGVHYKEYAESGSDGVGEKNFRRVVIDSQGDRSFRPVQLPLKPEDKMSRNTKGITQVPLDAPPVGGHVSLRNNRHDRSPERGVRNGDYSPVDRRRRRRRTNCVRNDPQDYVSRDDNEDQELDEFHLQLCTHTVEGFCLKNRQWRTYPMVRPTTERTLS